MPDKLDLARLRKRAEDSFVLTSMDTLALLDELEAARAALLPLAVSDENNPPPRVERDAWATAVNAARAALKGTQP